MQTLYLLRHAETVTGPRRFIGSTDVELSAAGKAAAANLAKSWHGAEPTIIRTSAMLRARQSAAAFSAALGLTPVTDARLNEMDFGEWEGLSWGQIERQSPQLARQWSDDWVERPAPAGESLALVHKRTSQALHDLLDEHPDCPVILIVAHAGSIRAMLCELLALPLQQAFDHPLDYLHRCELRRSPDAPWQLIDSNIGFSVD